MEFLYAAELKQRFACYGHFYELLLPGGACERCRSVLEIVDASIQQDDPPAIAEREPDAVVVMMNPGSSRPLISGHVDERIAYPRPGIPLRKGLVPTQPDNTQYQVMRVAVTMGWSHVRVLNLSDLRDPKSASFIQKTESITANGGGAVHSIFAPERTEECFASLMRRRVTPVLLGWGQDPGLLPLARLCMERLGAEPTCTVAAGNHPWLNAHPSPMLQARKLQWLGSIIRELQP